VIVTLQQSPLINAEITRSPEIPAISMLFSVFPKKLTTNDPGGMLGKIRVTMKTEMNDARKTIRLNIFSRFLVMGFSVYETGIII
jgi:hypothetical protein